LGVSVDTAAESEALRAQLSLPFSILCDTERRVITEWDLLNVRERGGIAKPSVFLIDPGLVVRYAAIDKVMSRVLAAEILSILEAAGDASKIRRKNYVPLARDWVRAIRNNFHKE
jgi:peroxiredoxin